MRARGGTLVVIPQFKAPDFLALAAREGVAELWRTLKTLPRERAIGRFLLARMLYIDGLNTIFAFGGIYAAGTFGFSFAEVIQFGIALNVTAALGAIAADPFGFYANVHTEKSEKQVPDAGQIRGQLRRES